jgi:hypothetical protein
MRFKGKKFGRVVFFDRIHICDVLSLILYCLCSAHLVVCAGAALAAGATALERAARDKAAAKAEAARQTQFAKIARPVRCQKKLSNESSYHTRYIWVNQNTSEFHWAKTGDVVKSKCVSIKYMCKAINIVPEVGAPNFTMELQNHKSAFTSMFSSVPTGLDVKLEDNELNQAFIDCIRYLMTK